MEHNQIFIWGYMASGKSTVGPKLAKKIDVPFYDLDVFIEQNFKSSIAEIFKNNGEAYFRELERKSLEYLTKNVSKFVLACGGGTPCYKNNANLMNDNGTTLFLETPINVIMERVLKDKKNERPLLSDKKADDLLHYITILLKNRNVFYGKAKFIINADQEPDKVVNVILDKLSIKRV